MDYVKKSIEKRALHKMKYDSRVNERLMQTTEEKIDTSNAPDALDASSDNSILSKPDLIWRMVGPEKGFAIAALKNELRKLTGNSVNTKFAKPSILGKPVLQPHRNQFVVRQPTAFKSERPKISKERFASQVDVHRSILHKGRTQSLVAEKTDISENRASRNFDLMINASFFMIMTSDHNRSELGIQDHSNEQSSSKLVPKVVP
ncbi:hypothetical protein Tco_1228006 [Tanacetum coccineum]